MTARDLIAKALQELRVLPAGGEPDAGELTDGLASLYGMLGSWQSFTNEWRRTRLTLPLPAGTISADLPSEVRTVSTARLIIGAVDRPMSPWEMDEYDLIPNKAQTGTPTAFATDRSQDVSTLYVWPAPSTNVVLDLTAQRRFVTSSDPAEEADVPDEWHETVWTNLALRLSGTFGADPLPELVNRAGSLLAQLRDDDRPASYFMCADA